LSRSLQNSSNFWTSSGSCPLCLTPPCYRLEPPATGAPFLRVGVIDQLLRRWTHARVQRVSNIEVAGKRLLLAGVRERQGSTTSQCITAMAWRAIIDRPDALLSQQEGQEFFRERNDGAHSVLVIRSAA